MSIRILLVDDHQIFREGLRALLHDQEDIEVVGESGDGRTAVGMARSASPNIVIMDVGMPGLNGVDATRQIRSRTPGVKVIALSIHADREYVTEMLGAGASAYLLKDGAFRELADAVRAVAQGKGYLSPDITGVVIEDFLRQADEGDDRAGGDVLTAREREVLQLLAEGKSTKETASILGIADKTVETHRQSVRDKLSLHSIADLTRYAVRIGLVSLEG